MSIRLAGLAGVVLAFSAGFCGALGDNWYADGVQQYWNGSGLNDHWYGDSVKENWRDYNSTRDWYARSVREFWGKPEPSRTLAEIDVDKGGRPATSRVGAGQAFKALAEAKKAKRLEIPCLSDIARENDGLRLTLRWDGEPPRVVTFAAVDAAALFKYARGAKKLSIKGIRLAEKNALDARGLEALDAGTPVAQVVVQSRNDRFVGLAVLDSVIEAGGPDLKGKSLKAAGAPRTCGQYDDFEAGR